MRGSKPDAIVADEALMRAGTTQISRLLSLDGGPSLRLERVDADPHVRPTTCVKSKRFDAKPDSILIFVYKYTW